MTGEKWYFQISEESNGKYAHSSYSNPEMLKVFEKSGKDRGEKVIYRFTYPLEKLNGISMKISNHLKELNKTNQKFNKNKLVEILSE
jgi:hypothetical protein